MLQKARALYKSAQWKTSAISKNILYDKISGSFTCEKSWYF